MATFITRRRVAFVAVVLGALVVLVGSTMAAGEGGGIINPAEAPASQLLDSAEAEALAATSHAAHLPSLAFHAFEGAPDYTWTFDGCFTSSSGTGFYEAAPTLPVGSTITGMSFHFYDVGAGAASALMVKVDHEGSNTATQTSVINMSTTGNAGYGEVTGVPTNPVLVEDNDFFIIQVGLTAGDHRVCGMEVFYEVPSSGDNLVFTPLDAPCKLFDTFLAPPGVFAGPVGPDDGLLSPVIAAPTAGQVTSQGGDAACAETAVPDDAVAVSINFTTRNVSQKGNIRAAASGAATKPVVNFSDTAVMNNSNEVTISLAGGAIDFEIGGQASGDDTLNVSGVVFGYYTPLPNFAD